MEYVVRVVSPCDQLDEMKRFRGGIATAFKSYCEKEFQMLWEPLYEQIGNCIPTRPKRQIWLDAVRLAIKHRSYIVAATNFLYAWYNQAKVQSSLSNRFKITDVVKKLVERGTVQRYDNLEHMPCYLKESVREVDIMAYNHADELSVVVQAMSYPLWFAQRVQAEVAAGAANMRRVINLCNTGRVANYELGDLTGDNDLYLIDPALTHLTDIAKDESTGSFSIKFLVENLKNITEPQKPNIRPFITSELADGCSKVCPREEQQCPSMVVPKVEKNDWCVDTHETKIFLLGLGSVSAFFIFLLIVWKCIKASQAKSRQSSATANTLISSNTVKIAKSPRNITSCDCSTRQKSARAPFTRTKSARAHSTRPHSTRAHSSSARSTRGQSHGLCQMPSHKDHTQYSEESDLYDDSVYNFDEETSI